MSAGIDPFIQMAALGLIAVVFARALVEKVSDYLIFAATLRDYRLLPDAVAPAAAVALLAAEAATLGLLLIPSTRSIGAMAAIALFALYAAAMSLALGAGRTEIECGCGGSGQIVSWLLVVRNLVLIALAALVALPVAPRALGLFEYAEIACAILIGCLALAIAEQTIETQSAVRRLQSQSWL